LICPENIISLHLNADGFYQPSISDQPLCNECGLCLSVCAFYNTEEVSKKLQVKGFSAWSHDKEVLKTCSSGGIGFEIGRLFLEKGYRVCAVRYNVEKRRAEHYISDRVEEFERSKGSKYLQSYTLDGFREFNTKDKFLVFATPCQIHSIRKYIQKMNCEGNYVLVDFFCHGVPSYKLWNRYVGDIYKQHDIGKLEKVNFRDKIFGRQTYTIMISGSNGSFYSSTKNKDIFYRLYLGDLCLNKACYKECKYKLDQSYADIRIGDLWSRRFKNNNEGLSGILSFTEKGKKTVAGLQTRCSFKQEETTTITEGQMNKPPRLPISRDWVLKKLDDEKVLSSRSLLVLLNLVKYRNKFHHLVKIGLKILPNKNYHEN